MIGVRICASKRTFARVLRKRMNSGEKLSFLAHGANNYFANFPVKAKVPAGNASANLFISAKPISILFTPW